MKRSSPDSADAGGGVAWESAANDGAGADASVKRKKCVLFEPVRLTTVSSTAHQDEASMRFAFKKVTERLRAKQRVENELRRRIKQAETRQESDDKMMVVINRYWNQLNDDVRVLLMRFDAEAALDAVKTDGHMDTAAFMQSLACGDDCELEEKMQQRVEFSLRAVGKLVATFDTLNDKNALVAQLVAQLAGRAQADASIKLETTEGEDAKIDTGQMKVDAGESDTANTPRDAVNALNVAIVQRNTVLEAENQRLQTALSAMHADLRRYKLEAKNYEDDITLYETKAEEANNRSEDVHWHLEKTMLESERLDFRLAETVRELEDATTKLAASRAKKRSKKQQEAASEAANNGSDDNDDTLANVTKSRLEQLEMELGEQRELAEGRLVEIGEYAEKYARLKTDLDAWKTQAACLPGDVVRATAEYRSLQAQFNRLFDDCSRYSTKFVAACEQIQKMREAHSAQIERISADETLAQNELRQEVMTQDEQLGKVRQEYEMLRLEFEQNLANNEQSGPLTKEIRQQYISLKQELQQQKQDVTRFKRKWREALSKELDVLRRERDNSLVIHLKPNETEAAIAQDVASKESAASPAAVDELWGEEGEINPDAVEAAADDDTAEQLKTKLEHALKCIGDLKAERKSFDSLSAEERTRVQLLIMCRRLRCERDRLKLELRRWHEMDRRDKHKYYNDDLSRRLRLLEESNDKLKREAAAAKDEEDTLLNEMEATGQAFEDMQEQNTRLLAQLKEKDDANFKLMTERIRLNQQQKRLMQEYDTLKQTVIALQTQTEAANQAVKHENEHAKLLRQHADALQKESHCRQLAVEQFRRRAAELAHTSADLKLQLEKTNTQLCEAQKSTADKTHAQETNAVQMRRVQEELDLMRRRLERAKKFERADRIDEVYQEEIRELKALLTCAACNRNRKDAILTKCQHTFCMDCIKVRYDARLRKCPKCNAPFGGNDYKRIWL